MKKITIDDLIPLLKRGWVAYAPRHGWIWYKVKPKTDGFQFFMYQTMDWWRLTPTLKENPILDIEPFDGDWKDSLRRVK